ncbi:helix-turn-helix domain-containing protein [Mycobacterium conspicuum]|uniref:helix-turn-helix domain-containing protein n=1 Tax=Mycobacterium conspicuum TaxID=44010 RepID=UPI0018D6137F|nr:helix-turn-helix domain-containing protein [Mycobacterium conspicuum]
MQIKTMGDLGVLVRSARTARGMTQADLAARLKTGRDWVVRLEKGHPRLEAQRVLDALRVLGVSLDATAPEAQSNDRAKRQGGAAPEKSDSARTADPFAALFGSKDA